MVRPEGGFYIFPSIRWIGKSFMEIGDYLLGGARVAIVSGSAFGSLGKRHIRIAYCSSCGNLDEGLRRIIAALLNSTPNYNKIRCRRGKSFTYPTDGLKQREFLYWEASPSEYLHVDLPSLVVGYKFD